MPPDPFAPLRTPSGRSALDLAVAGVAERTDHLRLVERLRAVAAPDLAASALAQAVLRDRGREKFGTDADRMFFTPDGLEQASRHEVASHRADRLAGAGVRSVLDAGAGIGGDAIAAARRGITVHAVERDPIAYAALTANVEALGLGGLVRTTYGDAMAHLDGAEAVYYDPARRADGKRIYDPERCAPPLSAVVATVRPDRAVVAKVSPAIDHADLPDGWEAEWVSTSTSSGRSVVEACLWSPALTGAVRRATLLPDGASITGSPDPELPTGPVGRFVHEPDGAVIRARLVAAVCAATGGRLLDRHIAYVTSDSPGSTPLATTFEVLETLPYRRKRVVEALRAIGPADLTVKKRGVEVEPAQLRRDLLRQVPDRSGPPVVLLLARVGSGQVAMLARRTSSVEP